ncbi:MAG: acetylxylan esterase [Candidatus Hydrogenedentes bacterium]|nr:acetylxylan esterase [Candidatus Hydrogenedentota bacterium]
MKTLFATLLCLAALPATASTHWFNAIDLSDSPRAVAPGTYQVWAWVPVASGGSLAVNGQTLAVPAGDENAQSRNKNGWYWVRAGEAACPDGQASIKLGEGVAAVALSTAADFDPAIAQARRRVLDRPEPVVDGRGQRARHTDTIFTMPPFETAADWEAYAEKLRLQVRLSSGLYPWPEKTPLNAEITGTITREDYSVSKVKFEAYPGFYVTGNLYRPLGDGPFPGMICPHGHWGEGRLEDSERGSIPARGITLARMGIVTFMYDMIGYVDSLQFDHNWGGEREKLWGVHPFALQLWSSVRAVDFLQSLPEVMPDRIGCTGASGGGTQTFALTAIDPRIRVSAPVNMISSRMQGGCLCENAPILRLFNSNMEIGALTAPNPLLLVSATGDWTRETPRVEYPAIRSIFDLYGAGDRVKNVHVDAPHNYNLESREAMYRFMGRWLLNESGWDGFTEPPYQIEPKEALRVFPDQERNTAEGEAIVERVIESIAARWDGLLAGAGHDPAAFAAAHRQAFAQVMGTAVPDAADLACERFRMEERGAYVQENWVLGRRGEGDAIPALFFRGVGPAPQDAVLLVSGGGKESFLDPATGLPGALVQGLIDAGHAVLCIDPFLTGEQRGVTEHVQRLRAGGFMDTFQPTDTGYRVQDVITAAAFLRARRDLTGSVTVAGLDSAGLWTLLASAVDGQMTKTYADLGGFDPESDQAWVEQHYLPCIRSVRDVKTASALIAPAPLFVATESATAPRGMIGAVGVASASGDAALLSLLK